MVSCLVYLGGGLATETVNFLSEENTKSRSRFGKWGWRAADMWDDGDNGSGSVGIYVGQKTRVK